VKLLFTAAGAVLAVLALTSSAFAHAHSREKWIAAALIVGVSALIGALIGFVASRARRPKPPAAPARPVYPFSGTGTRR
jgi:ABC-type branched-subunit amino acid transport system permease subunit